MKNNILALLWIIALSLLLIFSDPISELTYLTLSDTVKNVFPLLFPYSIAASLMVSTGIAVSIGNLIPLNRLFLMPKSAAAPLICGAICGFPLGAKTACDMYQCGYFSKRQAEIVVSISNNTGPSFIIGIIGMKYFSSIEIGIVIYIAQLLSSIVASLIINQPFDDDITHITPIKMPFGCALSEAIKSSFLSCLYVCAYISIFSTFLCTAIKLPEGLYGAISSFLEITGGARYGAAHGGFIGIFISAFSVGWSGLSVICQTMSYTFPLKLSIKPLIRMKIVQGIICAIICSLYFTSFKLQMITALALLLICLYIIKTSFVSKIAEN